MYNPKLEEAHNWLRSPTMKPRRKSHRFIVSMEKVSSLSQVISVAISSYFWLFYQFMKITVYRSVIKCCTHCLVHRKDGSTLLLRLSC